MNAFLNFNWDAIELRTFNRLEQLEQKCFLQKSRSEMSIAKCRDASITFFKKIILNFVKF